ncbi:MAG: myxococcus cysteine-rich repeat containing protein, partial [Nanoarchaeota archaeon]
GVIIPQHNLINICAQAGHLTTAYAGTFDQYLNGAETTLSSDRVNCYRVTIKRVNNFATPVFTLPAPVIQTSRNIRKIVYQPYNFGVSDIASAIQTAIPGRVGIGMGGVVYDSSGRDIAAHMFQPLAIDPTQFSLPSGERRYHFKIYDPYFGSVRDITITNDSQQRIFANLWTNQGIDQWFHLEELLMIENLGPCTNQTNLIVTVNSNPTTVSGGGRVTTGARPVRGLTGPTTPISCGSRVQGPGNICSINMACPPGDYCSYSNLCTCTTPICGDGEKAPKEQCDDGNTINGDGCSATCAFELGFCAGVIPSIQAGTCNNPGGVCMYVGNFGITQGICTAQCKCEYQFTP